MKKIVLFPLNNDTELLIKNRSSEASYQIAAVTGFVEDKYRLEELQRESKIYCDVDFEKCINMADAIVFAVLIVVLLVKPTGLMGKNIQEKV